MIYIYFITVMDFEFEKFINVGCICTLNVYSILLTKNSPLNVIEL
jgi:hypothetical protein